MRGSLSAVVTYASTIDDGKCYQNGMMAADLQRRR